MRERGGYYDSYMSAAASNDRRKWAPGRVGYGSQGGQDYREGSDHYSSHGGGGHRENSRYEMGK
mgnify:CR=1 FL=1|jgi:hypothetical protein